MPNELDFDPRDLEMETHIYQQVRGMGSHFHVKVKDGTATLSGTAEDFEEKRQIDTIVKRVGGVRRVVNQIRVISTESSFDNNR